MKELNFINFAQRLADFLVVMVSFILGHWYYTIVQGRTVPYTFFGFMLLGALAALMFVVIFQSAKLYQREMSLLNVVETRRILTSWLFGSLLLFSATFYFRVLDLSRIMVTSSLLVTLVLILIERGLFYKMHLALNYSGQNSNKAVVYGAGAVGRHLLKRIYHSPALGIHAIGFLDDDTTLWNTELSVREVSASKGFKVYGGMDRLEELKIGGLKEVFVALPRAPYERTYEIVQKCQELGLAVSVVPPTYGRHMHRLDVVEIGGIPILREKESKPSIFYPVFKRAFDLFFASLAIFLLGPIFILIACLVKLDSPGPIIFRQKRVGLGGKQFDFFKFRTMYSNSSAYAVTPQSADDPRITKFGRFLRRSSLDELPQFFSVITGDMSVVGPRPEMPFIVETYNESQRDRLLVKPGITGIWQISAVRGEPIHANIEYDLFYIENQSLLLDIIIVLKTVVGAIRGIGAV